MGIDLGKDSKGRDGDAQQRGKYFRVYSPINDTRDEKRINSGINIAKSWKVYHGAKKFI